MPPRSGPGGFKWNVTAGRYVNARGQFVPRQAVRRAIDAAIDNTAKQMRATSEGLRNGTVTLDEWHLQMRTHIKNTHLWNRAAARGGWAQMTPKDYGAVGNAVRAQYAYVDRFAGEIAAETQKLDGRFLRRAEMYAQAGRRTYDVADREENAARGRTRERNILGDADHCGECVALSARGWVAIGTLTPIGSRECLTSCRCFIEYE